MRRLWAKLFLLAIAVSVFLPEIALAKKKAAPLIVVAHTTKLSGINAWWSALYNDNLIVFTILTGVAVPIAGAFLGILGDILLSLTGIDLRKRELAEH